MLNETKITPEKNNIVILKVLELYIDDNSTLS